ncbi:MAG: electron transfer flavoprotein subunit alpha/FixB family protein [Alphaproteobacteria bacterium]|nr:electron transfer flavoprotein subunit alpha/FixB family protein [Alphaproteobacteria bacterium]
MNDPPKRVRRDPRAERQGRAVAAPAPVAAEAPTRVIAEPAYLILAVPDMLHGRLSPHDRDVLGAARALADEGGGAVAVLAWAAADFAGAGADRLALVAVTDCEARAATLAATIRHLAPRHVLLPDTLTGGGDLGRRVGARLGLRAAGDVRQAGLARVVRRAHGGAEDWAGAPPPILLLAPEAAAPHAGPRHEARPIELDPVAVTPRVRDDGPVAVDAVALPLGEADFIVAAGNGVTDWEAFHQVAAALGATVGGSRVVCDAGHLPRHRQVGASGTLVAPRCYLAFGIAGASQHLQGIARCEAVIAVNSDLHADMIKRADLAIVADAQSVMPALAARVRRGDA